MRLNEEYTQHTDFPPAVLHPAKADHISTPIYVWLLTFANLALILVALFLFSRSHEAPATAAVTGRDQPAPINKDEPAFDMDALNPYGQVIAKAGLTKCARPMNDLSGRLLSGKKVGIYRFPIVQNNFASFSMEVAAREGAILYVTFNLSQNPDGSCQISYEAVSDWANSCEEIIKTIFKDFTPTRNLLKAVALLTHKDNKNRKIFTMPVQNGCIAIEKEIISTYN
jgi:hypothetical protein